MRNRRGFLKVLATRAEEAAFTEPKQSSRDSLLHSSASVLTIVNTEETLSAAD